MFLTAVLDFVFRLRIERTGSRVALILGGAFNYRDYHKVRREHGWPARPVYLMWALTIIGLALLIAGFFLHFGTHPNPAGLQFAAQTEATEWRCELLLGLSVRRFSSSAN